MKYDVIMSIGGFLTLIGLIGIAVPLFSQDGALAITGAIIFSAGHISQAIASQREDKKSTEPVN